MATFGSSVSDVENTLRVNGHGARGGTADTGVAGPREQSPKADAESVVGSWPCNGHCSFPCFANRGV